MPLFYDVYGEKTKLVLLTDKCFSWGLQNEKSGDYKLPIPMKGKNVQTGELEPTVHQQMFMDCFHQIKLKCKEHCFANKVDIGRADLEKADLRNWVTVCL